ncbi:nucleoside triphosphate pyrophosphohydrolase [Streptomyces sp. NPDC056817]|uniref:nucleoside triphosphate pyrophosphohydrolase n=1 Tax=Streptomyces sp. NPDC056817 TaxID=3345950 RepID=UPI0036A6945D
MPDAKLIRDRIPDIAAARGQTLEIRVAEPGEMTDLLRAKLLEEANEAAGAEPGDLLEELADVLEVVHALAAASGHALTELDQARARKAAARGAFTQRLVMTIGGKT